MQSTTAAPPTGPTGNFRIDGMTKPSRQVLLVTASADTREALLTVAATDAVKAAAVKEGNDVRGLSDMPKPYPDGIGVPTKVPNRFVAEYKLFLNV